uniref:Ubiquinol-cytochrome C reductase hinge protein,domain-containing protein n=2 Tax=Schistosoma japonicum TaxID=6182 RepID=B3GUT1_SCHJA|nr:Ubiquinol-cytochrome C reductase hinge protein,domain-containing protein [Schistosoma japonicum]CAX74537.1 Ubiquinol-cytochrome C reductase hinge protein,domain-containing protein [Schistosoma japonicum]CAX74538.1 Ubiquinol-cytochrome C reductase hinge protein,domain-containing protein [Schistosoma japonicum]
MSEEVVDPLVALREEAKGSSHCSPFLKKLGECGDRQSRTKESCEEELIDLLGCVDHEVAKKIFSVLK